MLPSYSSVVNQQEEENQRNQQQQQQQHIVEEPTEDRNLDTEQQQPPTFRQTYEGLHQQQQSYTRSLRLQQQQQVTPQSIREGQLEMNLAFLQSPAGGLLAANTILGLVLAICGSVPLWSQTNGGSFCVFSGLVHFAGASFLFFAYLFGYVDVMPWFARPLALYYYLLSAGFSLIAFVFSASTGNGLLPAGIAAAVFSFLALAVDIVLIVLSYMALKLGYRVVQSDQEALVT